MGARTFNFRARSFDSLVYNSVYKVSTFPSGHFASDASSNKAFLVILSSFLDKNTVQMKLAVVKD